MYLLRRAIIDVIRDFASVKILGAVRTGILAQVHVGLLDVSSTVGPLHKLLATQSTREPTSGGSGYTIIDT